MDIISLKRMQKKYFSLLFSVVNIVVLFLIYEKYERLMTIYYGEYARLKEMYFLVNNRVQTNITLTESSVSTFFKSKGLDVDSVTMMENGIQVKLKQSDPKLLIETVYSLEKNGLTINTLKAIDNTGTGKMSVDMVIR